jgi:hypothetical protein
MLLQDQLVIVDAMMTAYSVPESNVKSSIVWGNLWIARFIN